MARLPRIDVPGALYHVIARGNQRRVIFRDAPDYQRYLDLLRQYQERHKFTLYAYVLLPNHLHLLLSPTRVPLSKTMQGLQQSYTRHFNRRYRLVGHCFQGRYRAILCESDAYLLELVRYLHLNPVRARLNRNVDGYRWSSHRLYLAGRDAEGVAVETILGQFSPTRDRAVAAYRAFVQAGLPADHRDDLYEVISQRILGAEHFAERMEREARHSPPRPPVDVSLEAIARQVARSMGTPEAGMRGQGRSRTAALARAVVSYLAREEGSLSLRTVARFLGRDDATLSLAVQRLEARLAVDSRLAAKVSHLRRALRRGSRRKVRKQIIKA